MFSGLGGGHLGFRLPVTWYRVQSITIEKPVVENIGFEFRMVFLSSVQDKIYVFPFWAAPLVFRLPVTWDSVQLNIY